MARTPAGPAELRAQTLGGAALAGRRQTKQSSERLAWYPWYPSDWLSETRGWSLLERGLRHELLDCQWDLGTLPASPGELQALVSASPAEWRQAWPRVQASFPRVNGGRQNARLAALREDRQRAYARRRDAAQRTNHARWGSVTDSVTRLG